MGWNNSKISVKRYTMEQREATQRETTSNKRDGEKKLAERTKGTRLTSRVAIKSAVIKKMQRERKKRHAPIWPIASTRNRD